MALKYFFSDFYLVQYVKFLGLIPAIYPSKSG